MQPIFVRCAALLLLLFGGIGVARAQLVCTGNMPNPQIVSMPIEVNRTTPLGKIAGTIEYDHNGARVQCTGGTFGMPLQVMLRVPDGTTWRANPFGPGIVLDTTVPGIGIAIETVTPVSITSGSEIIVDTTRNILPTQLLDSVSLTVYPVKTGEINLMQDYALHGFPILRMAWRSPGFQDNWTDVATYAFTAMEAGELNVRTETCYLGEDAHTPLAKTENLGTVAGGDFAGIGSEAPSRNVTGTLTLRCRNYAGGTMTVSSDQAHPTMPGVLRNALTGPDASTGVGVRLRQSLGGPEWNLHAPWPIPGFGEAFRNHYFTYHARYVQTDAPIRAGAFSATVTFTVHYE